MELILKADDSEMSLLACDDSYLTPCIDKLKSQLQSELKSQYNYVTNPDHSTTWNERRTAILERQLLAEDDKHLRRLCVGLNNIQSMSPFLSETEVIFLQLNYLVKQLCILIDMPYKDHIVSSKSRESCVVITPCICEDYAVRLGYDTEKLNILDGNTKRRMLDFGVVRTTAETLVVKSMLRQLPDLLSKYYINLEQFPVMNVLYNL